MNEVKAFLFFAYFRQQDILEGHFTGNQRRQLNAVIGAPRFISEQFNGAFKSSLYELLCAMHANRAAAHDDHNGLRLRWYKLDRLFWFPLYQFRFRKA